MHFSMRKMAGIINCFIFFVMLSLARGDSSDSSADTRDNFPVKKTIKAIFGNEGKSGISPPVYEEIEVEFNGTHCMHHDEERQITVLNLANSKSARNNKSMYFNCDDASNEDWDGYNKTRAYSPRNEAFLYATKYVDMWRELISNTIQPYSEERELTLFVHYGKNYSNSFFNQYAGAIFGDGDEDTYPATSLDLVCHELGHGITKWLGQGGGLYTGSDAKESGVMDEAYADIIGETCDMHFNDKANYLIGDDIMKPGKGEAIRDMCNPSKYGGLENYTAEYNDDIDEHFAAGIYNKAWCNLTKTQEWDYIKTFQMFTLANINCWAGYNMTMNCGACGVQLAAAYMALNETDVTNAFAGVGISCGDCNQTYQCKDFNSNFLEFAKLYV